MIGKYCVIRTYSAGVHVGTVQSIDGKNVVLTGARRIWNWRDRMTLNEVSLRGVGDGSRVAEVVESILLTEMIECIPTTDEARKNLEGAKWTP